MEISEFFVVVRVVEIDGKGLFNELLDVHEEFVLFGGAIGDGGAIGSGTTGAADTVDVGFGLVRDVDVDNEGDVFDIDSTSGYVGGDEDGEAACLEFFQSALALGLGAVSVDRFGFETVGVDGFAELIRAVFGAGEDDGESVVLLVSEVLEEEVLFVILVDEADTLVDFFGGGLLGLDGDVGGVIENGSGEGLNGRREGGGEEEGLLFAREGGDDLFDVAEEAHVEHAINFIEDEKFDAGEVDVALVHVIEETARAGDEDVDALFHGADLWVFPNTTEDEGLAEADVFAVGLEALRDLAGELAGGGEDEDAGGSALGMTWVVVEGVEDGQREGCGFSGAGLGDSHEIAAFEKDRDRLSLDGRGDGVVLLGESTLEGSCEGKLLECSRGHVVLRGRWRV